MPAPWRLAVMARPDRQRAERRGRRAEQLAAFWLLLQGWHLVARRFRTPAGEIDLILRRGRQLLYVEVKQRASLGEAQMALTPRSLSRLARAATFAQAKYDEQGRLNHRCDALLIAPWQLPSHIRDVVSIR
jgi:putative endonuclease